VTTEVFKQIPQRRRHDLDRRLQVLQPHVLVGAVGVGVQDRARTGAIEHGRDAARCIVARVGIERHAGFLDRNAENFLGVALQRRDETLGALHRLERLGEHDALRFDADALALAGFHDERDQALLNLGGVLLRDHAPVEAEGDAIGHHIGVDAAGDQSDIELGRTDARRFALMRASLRSA
jgi:hypothetical protein